MKTIFRAVALIACILFVFKSSLISSRAMRGFYQPLEYKLRELNIVGEYSLRQGGKTSKVLRVYMSDGKCFLYNGQLPDFFYAIRAPNLDKLCRDGGSAYEVSRLKYGVLVEEIVVVLGLALFALGFYVGASKMRDEPTNRQKGSGRYMDTK